MEMLVYNFANLTRLHLMDFQRLWLDFDGKQLSHCKYMCNSNRGLHTRRLSLEDRYEGAPHVQVDGLGLLQHKGGGGVGPGPGPHHEVP